MKSKQKRKRICKEYWGDSYEKEKDHGLIDKKYYDKCKKIKSQITLKENEVFIEEGLKHIDSSNIDLNELSNRLVNHSEK